jgi:hypothetical protein
MVHEALAAIVKEGHRAADVIQRIRQLAATRSLSVCLCFEDARSTVPGYGVSC